MKPSILYLAPCALREGVGGSARLKNMLDVLNQLEVNTQLISYLQGEKFKVRQEQINNHLNTTTVWVRRSWLKILKAFALVPIFTYGLRYIRKTDIMFAHAPGVLTGFPALVLSKIFNKPLLIDHMDIKDPDTPLFIYYHVLKNSNIVFTISRFLEEEVKQIGCRNVVYLPVFIDTNAFEKDALERAEIRNNLDIDDKEILIGYTGSFSHIEGLPFLFKAFQSLTKIHENIRLVVVGGRNVPNSDDVPQLISELALKEKVICIPQQPYKLIPKYLSAFDILCSPKIDCAENRAANPIKIYEYMSMGIPTVASAVGEISKVIENGIDGFLVKPGDEDDLGTTLEYVIQNLDSAKEAGERARKKIIMNYSQQVMLEKIRDALKSLGTK